VDAHPAVPPTTFVSECRRIDRTWCKQMGFDPNHFYRHRKSGRIFLVLSPGKSGDFAMNKASLDYLAAATTATGTVVLLKNGGDPAARRRLAG